MVDCWQWLPEMANYSATVQGKRGIQVDLILTVVGIDAERCRMYIRYFKRPLQNPEERSASSWNWSYWSDLDDMLCTAQHVAWCWRIKWLMGEWCSLRLGRRTGRAQQQSCFWHSTFCSEAPRCHWFWVETVQFICHGPWHRLQSDCWRWIRRSWRPARSSGLAPGPISSPSQSRLLLWSPGRALWYYFLTG